MADLYVSNSIEINSAINNYSVIFCEACKSFEDSYFYVVDSKVYEKYNNLFTGTSNLIVLDISEDSKTYNSVLLVIDKLQVLGLRRGSTIAAIGGGIIQDIVCFIASIYMRGVDWIFFPTTLLSQADSCIGSKSSINTESTKNLLGTFYPPRKVYIDTKFLSSLSDLDIKSGVGEIIKIFNLFDQKNLKKLNNDYESVVISRENLYFYIYQALLLKKQIIELDEFDRFERLVMNYGHTFGHALEKATNFAIPHGIAVSFGMDIANFLSFKLSKLSSRNYLWHKNLLSKNYFEYIGQSVDIDDFLLALDDDKKNSKDFYNFIMYVDDKKIDRYAINKSENIRNVMQLYFDETFNGK